MGHQDYNVTKVKGSEWVVMKVREVEEVL